MLVFSRKPRLPAVVGHRGVRRPDVAENTPPAFALAAHEGADWVELDARRSADGVIVLYHNPYTPDRVAVVARTAAELAADHGICTLAEVLPALPDGLGVNVEVKNLPAEPDYDPTDALVDPVIDQVRSHAGTRPVLFSSFNPLTLQALTERLPDTPTGLITWDSFSMRAAIPVAREYGATVLVPRLGSPGLDAEGVAEAHEQGLSVMVWTVNDMDTARMLGDADVDALCTDDPGLLRTGFATPPA